MGNNPNKRALDNYQSVEGKYTQRKYQENHIQVNNV